MKTRAFLCLTTFLLMGYPAFADGNDDTDGDGINDNMDDCPQVADPNQVDGDGDGLGDACDPCPDDEDTDCTAPSGGAQQADPGAGASTEPDANVDTDGDGIPDVMDNCPNTPNPTQEASDADDMGDACDPCPTNPDPMCVSTDPQPAARQGGATSGASTGGSTTGRTASSPTTPRGNQPPPAQQGGAQTAAQAGTTQVDLPECTRTMRADDPQRARLVELHRACAAQRGTVVVVQPSDCTYRCTTPARDLSAEAATAARLRVELETAIRESAAAKARLAQAEADLRCAQDLAEKEADLHRRATEAYRAAGGEVTEAGRALDSARDAADRSREASDASATQARRDSARLGAAADELESASTAQAQATGQLREATELARRERVAYAQSQRVFAELRTKLEAVTFLDEIVRGRTHASLSAKMKACFREDRGGQPEHRYDQACLAQIEDCRFGLDTPDTTDDDWDYGCLGTKAAMFGDPTLGVPGLVDRFQQATAQIASDLSALTARVTALQTKVDEALDPNRNGSWANTVKKQGVRLNKHEGRLETLELHTMLVRAYGGYGSFANKGLHLTLGEGEDQRTLFVRGNSSMGPIGGADIVFRAAPWLALSLGAGFWSLTTPANRLSTGESVPMHHWGVDATVAAGYILDPDWAIFSLGLSGSFLLPHRNPDGIDIASNGAKISLEYWLVELFDWNPLKVGFALFGFARIDDITVDVPQLEVVGISRHLPAQEVSRSGWAYGGGGKLVFTFGVIE
ncbi:MAG: thrombospondin type 3 repeat-containing protein [Patescibacteria group bacterium]